MNLAAAAPEQTESTVPHDRARCRSRHRRVARRRAVRPPCSSRTRVFRRDTSNVVPASWGDELVAAGVSAPFAEIRHGPRDPVQLPDRRASIARRRRRSAARDAAARFTAGRARAVRARALTSDAHRGSRTSAAAPARSTSRSTFACRPSADRMLAERQIVLDDQPRVFESIIPPDRRRYSSQPGGVPSAERLWTDLGSRAFVEVETDDFVSEYRAASSRRRTVLDGRGAATRLCLQRRGAGHPAARCARLRVVALEPPRSNAAVVEEQTPLDLDLPIPAVPRRRPTSRSAYARRLRRWRSDASGSADCSSNAHSDRSRASVASLAADLSTSHGWSLHRTTRRGEAAPANVRRAPAPYAARKSRRYLGRSRVRNGIGGISDTIGTDRHPRCVGHCRANRYARHRDECSGSGTVRCGDERDRRHCD